MDILPLSECLKICKDITEDSEYSLKKAKAPKSKRALQKNLLLWGSLTHHLAKLEQVNIENSLNVTL